MAKEFNRGDPIFIPFLEGKTVTDSQLMPRMYKTREAFQKYFPSGYVKRDSVELAEYNEVVRCWIPVSEPPKEWRNEDGEAINFLIYSPGIGIDIGNWIEPTKMWFCLGVPFNVTHWMPLPEPPKEE